MTDVLGDIGKECATTGCGWLQCRMAGALWLLCNAACRVEAAGVWQCDGLCVMACLCSCARFLIRGALVAAAQLGSSVNLGNPSLYPVDVIFSHETRARLPTFWVAAVTEGTPLWCKYCCTEAYRCVLGSEVNL